MTEKYIFARTDFFGAFLSITLGTFCTGLFALGSKQVRVALVEDLPKIRGVLPNLIEIELINWAALYTGQTAVNLGIPFGECDRGEYPCVCVWTVSGHRFFESTVQCSSQITDEVVNDWVDDGGDVVDWGWS